VQEHTNDRVALRKSDYAAFLKFMLTHGLSVDTISAILGQMMKEPASGARWKRATLLDKLQWGLFAWYPRKYRPHRSTFFLNSTARFQHLYRPKRRVVSDFTGLTTCRDLRSRSG
jgi:hypothetical protein